MGFMDELRKLTQPYEDEDDFYEGASVQEQPPAPTEAQIEFESAFGGKETPEAAEEEPGEENSRLFFLIPGALTKQAIWCSTWYRGEASS